MRLGGHQPLEPEALCGEKLGSPRGRGQGSPGLTREGARGFAGSNSSSPNQPGALLRTLCGVHEYRSHPNLQARHVGFGGEVLVEGSRSQADSFRFSVAEGGSVDGLGAGGWAKALALKVVCAGGTWGPAGRLRRGPG